MKVIAKLNYLHISPRKVRLVTDLIKGMDVEDAKNQLQFFPKRSSKPILKLLNSGITNAEHNFDIPKDNLYIENIIVNKGPMLKRWLPRARGIATPIQKKTSHVILIINERFGVARKTRKKSSELENIVESFPKSKKEIKLDQGQSAGSEPDSLKEKEETVPRKQVFQKSQKESKNWKNFIRKGANIGRRMFRRKTI